MVIPWMAVLAAMVAVPTASQADVPQPLLFDCDAPAGQVSTMDPNHLTPATTISGNLLALEARQGGDLRPVASVSLASQRDFVVLQITPVEASDSRFQVFVRNGDAREEERLPLGEVTLNQSMPFRVALDGKNVTVAAGGQTLSVRQSFRGTPNVAVSCSTGRFRFQNVEMQ